jgi:hypothetical protein
VKNFYLLAAVVGAIVPYYFFTQFFLAEGANLVVFLEGIFANGAAGGFAADIFISSAIFWSYLIVKKEPGLWKYILLNLAIGLSCALPYYLYVKESEREAVTATA